MMINSLVGWMAMPGLSRTMPEWYTETLSQEDRLKKMAKVIHRQTSWTEIALEKINEIGEAVNILAAGGTIVGGDGGTDSSVTEALALLNSEISSISSDVFSLSSEVQELSTEIEALKRNSDQPSSGGGTDSSVTEALYLLSTDLDSLSDTVENLKKKVDAIPSTGGGGSTPPAEIVPVDLQFNIPRGLGTFTVTGEYVGLDNYSLTGGASADNQWSYVRYDSRMAVPDQGAENTIYDIKESGVSISYIWVPGFDEVMSQYNVDLGNWSSSIAGGCYVPVLTTAGPSQLIRNNLDIKVYWSGAMRTGKKVFTYLYGTRFTYLKTASSKTIKDTVLKMPALNPYAVVSVDCDRATNGSELVFDNGVSWLIEVDVSTKQLILTPAIDSSILALLESKGQEIDFLVFDNIRVEFTL